MALTTSDPDVVALRPSWRGRLHLVGAVVAVPMFLALQALAGTWPVALAVGVYGVAVVAMLGVSATYHSGRLSPRAEQRMKRVDHSTILVAIAGSYTAVVALTLSGSAEVRLLVLVWSATVVGIAVRMAWLGAPRPVGALVYLVVGWTALLEAPAIAGALDGLQFALLLGGGVLYSLGAVVYAARRPDPWPATFGYHEVFHAFVVVAALAHYAVVADLLLARR